MSKALVSRGITNMEVFTRFRQNLYEMDMSARQSMYNPQGTRYSPLGQKCSPRLVAPLTRIRWQRSVISVNFCAFCFLYAARSVDRSGNLAN